MAKRLAPAAYLLLLAWVACAHKPGGEATSQEERLAAAESLQARGRWARAITEYETVLSEFPKQEVAERAKFNVAKCRIEVGEYDTAIRELEEFSYSYPSSPLVDDAMYLIALAHFRQSARPERDQSKTTEALDELTLLLRTYPDTDMKQDAEEMVAQCRSKLAEKDCLNGELYLKLENYQAARIYFDSVIAAYADTEWAARALLGKGIAFEKESNFDEARRLYEQVLREYPSTPPGREASVRLRGLGEGRGTQG